MPRAARARTARHVTTTAAIGAYALGVCLHELHVEGTVVKAAALKVLERVLVPLRVILDLFQLLCTGHAVAPFCVGRFFERVFTFAFAATFAAFAAISSA